MDADRAKSAAAKAALDGFVRDGMRIGLGSGSTSQWFVRHLGEAVRGGLSVVGVPSSSATRDLAQEVGVPLSDLEATPALDLCVDGADEIDAEGTMIKGGGGALLWEKIVAAASAQMVAVVDESKVVDTLGAFPLPIEVVQFGWTSTRRSVQTLLAAAGHADPRIERREAGGAPFVTDSGHFILDAHLEAISNPRMIGEGLNRIPGVVENGLFLGIADAMVLARADGTTAVTRFS